MLNEEICFFGGKTCDEWLKSQLELKVETHIVGQIVQAAYSSGFRSWSGSLNYFSCIISDKEENDRYEWHGEGLVQYLESLQKKSSEPVIMYASLLSEDDFKAKVKQNKSLFKELNVEEVDDAIIDDPLNWWMGDIHKTNAFLAGPDLIFWLWEYLKTGMWPNVWTPNKVDFLDCKITDHDVIQSIDPESFSYILHCHNWDLDYIILADDDWNKIRVENYDEVNKKYPKMRILAEHWFKKIKRRAFQREHRLYLVKDKSLRDFVIRTGEALDVYSEVENISQIAALMQLGVKITKERVILDEC